MKKLSKKALRASYIRWLFGNNSAFSFTWLQTYNFADAMVPVLEELYGDDKEELKKALTRHSVFFNTEPIVGGVINGIVANMEEQRANGHTEIDDEDINGLKAGLMGPMAGVGDSLKAGLYVPLILCIGIGLAGGGNVLGPLVYLALWFGTILPLSYFLFMKGYESGAQAIDWITGEKVKRIAVCLNMLAAIVVGGVTAGNINIGPRFLPLGVIMFCWWLISKKKMSALKVMGIMVIAAVAVVFAEIL